PVVSSESVPTVGVVVPSGGSSVLVDVPVSLLLREVLASLTVLSLVSGAVVRLLEVTGGVVLAVGSNDEPGRSSQSTGPSFTHWLQPQHHTPRTSACEPLIPSILAGRRGGRADSLGRRAGRSGVCIVAEETNMA